MSTSPHDTTDGGVDSPAVSDDEDVGAHVVMDNGTDDGTDDGAGIGVDVDTLAVVLDDFAVIVGGDFDDVDVLARLVRGVVEVLPVDGAGVMVPDGGGSLRLVDVAGPSRDVVARAGRVQQDVQEGPCHDSHRCGEVVHVDDLAAADVAAGGAWPRYRQQVAGLGIRGVTAVPLLARGRSWGVLDVYRTRTDRFTLAQMAAVRTMANVATSYLVIAADRRAAARTHAELTYRALHDPLTDLPVREVLLDQLTRSLARLARHPGRVGVLFVDLDGLKYVNDTYGHAAGDRLLTTCAHRVREALRPSDLLARVGGDEFVVLLEDLPGPADARDVAHRVLAALSASYELDGRDIAPSASVGIAVTDDPTTSADTLVAHADSAMYRAKRAGRGRVDLFDADDYESARVRASSADRDQGALRAALEGGQLRLHYQPVHHFPTSGALAGAAAGFSALVAVEALLRWQRPGHGLLSAGVFLGDAEATGLMSGLGAWVLRNACTQLAAWDTVLGARAPRTVLVNISALELTDPGLPRRVARTLAAAGLAPGRLVLEITETALVTDEPTALTTVHALLDIGCGLAIDDFGTGYSSLRRLVDLPATTLKIDRSFTRDLRTSPAAAAVVAAVLSLGRDLGRTVVVEGVEDPATLQALLDLGATHLQGYHLTRPSPPDQITALLAGPGA